MPLNSVLFSSEKEDWETPLEFFNKLDGEFHFDLDVCASPQNAKCKEFFTKEQNGLEQSWRNRTCWMNPPYGKSIGNWMKKAEEESRLSGALVVCLVPARTDTKWFHDCVLKAQAEVRFVRGRIKFVGATASAPFPSVVVIFRPVKK